MSRVLKIPEHVVFRSFPAETVVLNLETGLYHGLNPTAGRMLEALAQHGDLEEAAQAVASAYSASLDAVRGDLQSLVGELVTRGLLIADRRAAPSPAAE